MIPTSGRTITCPACGTTWTCPDFCYPGCHAIDKACEGRQTPAKQGKLKTSVLYLPRPAAKYHGCYPMHFERRLPQILESVNFVHFFAGMSVSGYRIDCNPAVKPDLVANVERLDIPDNSFDAGMADPPYTPEFAKNLYNTEYPSWSKWTKELVRVVRPGGRIAIMQNYIVPRLPGCEMEEIVVILLRIKQYPKIVTVQRKL